MRESLRLKVFKIGMRILGMDTSGDTCSVSIMDGDRILVDLFLNDKNTHSVNLMPLLDDALKQSACPLADIDAFAVNIGPGSFTGIRIGVCTVMGLALNRQTPCIGVNTLESLAYHADAYMGTICAMIDARRAECYWALFQSNQSGIRRMSEDGAEKVEDILKKLPEGRVCFVGDGAVRNRAQIEEFMGNRAEFLPEGAMATGAVSVLKAARIMAEKGEITTVYDLEPYYLRPSQAERMKTSL